MNTIPVYIGTSKRFDCIKGMTERSILAHTSAPVEIVHLYPEVEEGCTGFSNVRYTIRYGIYLEIDMIVYGDIADLWEMREPGKYVCMVDGSTEVAVIDNCQHQCRNKREHYRLPMVRKIPMEWNCEDRVELGMKLLHFTALDTQPWFYSHPDDLAVAEYEKWAM